MTNKNDANDAHTIAETVTRPKMRFVAIKTEIQQETLALHKVREQMKKQRAAQSNHIRGLLAEFGIVFKQGFAQMQKLPEILELNKEKLSESFIHILN